MKETELRIGNLILVKFNDEIGKKISDEWTIEKVNYNHIKDISTNNKDVLYKPIEITEELLLKFGFAKYTGWDDMVYWCLPDEHGDPERFEVFENQKGFELSSGAICESVHLLQNAYFFHYLNGKELTIITDAKP